ncbi:HpsJ family protein [Ancylothrix sp. C2]|uniref:hormogonium polysaccharide biosynthesis protein HpsJ n=1 Tax=Ancylothrix sp. D3o TaxID=2953691 RepID=UPI0021BAB77C|nr:HpsJ family protein [Ancylothrix sp. D3o]MCT7952051.1 HpsJ family protein [Ancylothrix sp. D3o]
MIDLRQPTAIAARTLTIVGIILIISSLIDYVMLLYPANPTQSQWRLAVITQLVDRGILPMVGLAFLFAGYGFEAAGGNAASPRKALTDIKFWGLVLASLLGLLFLLLFPLHLNNIRLDRTEKVNAITQQATVAEARVTSQVNNPEIAKEIEKQRDLAKNQLAELSKDPEKLEQAINSPQIPEPIKQVLQQSKTNPQVLQDFLNNQLNPQTLADRELQRIRSERQNAEEQTNQAALKSGIQTGSSALLLALGYSLIGWTGLKNLGYVKLGRRKQAR